MTGIRDENSDFQALRISAQAWDRIPITLEGHRSRDFAKIIMSIRTATLTSTNNIEIRSVELLSPGTQNLNLIVSTLDCVNRDALSTIILWRMLKNGLMMPIRGRREGCQRYQNNS